MRAAAKVNRRSASWFAASCAIALGRFHVAQPRGSQPTQLATKRLCDPLRHLIANAIDQLVARTRKRKGQHVGIGGLQHARKRRDHRGGSDRRRQWARGRGQVALDAVQRVEARNSLGNDLIRVRFTYASRRRDVALCGCLRPGSRSGRAGRSRSASTALCDLRFATMRSRVFSSAAERIDATASVAPRAAGRGAGALFHPRGQLVFEHAHRLCVGLAQV